MQQPERKPGRGGWCIGGGIDRITACDVRLCTWNSAFLGSEDLGEAVAAFMQKRAPQFKGA